MQNKFKVLTDLGDDSSSDEEEPSNTPDSTLDVSGSPLSEIELLLTPKDAEETLDVTGEPLSEIELLLLTPKDAEETKVSCVNEDSVSSPDSVNVEQAERLKEIKQYNDQVIIEYIRDHTCDLNDIKKLMRIMTNRFTGKIDLDLLSKMINSKSEEKKTGVDKKTTGALSKADNLAITSNNEVASYFNTIKTAALMELNQYVYYKIEDTVSPNFLNGIEEKVFGDEQASTEDQENYKRAIGFLKYVDLCNDDVKQSIEHKKEVETIYQITLTKIKENLLSSENCIDSLYIFKQMNECIRLKENINKLTLQINRLKEEISLYFDAYGKISTSSTEYFRYNKIENTANNRTLKFEEYHSIGNDLKLVSLITIEQFEPTQDYKTYKSYMNQIYEENERRFKLNELNKYKSSVNMHIRNLKKIVECKLIEHMKLVTSILKKIIEYSTSRLNLEDYLKLSYSNVSFNLLAFMLSTKGYQVCLVSPLIFKTEISMDDFLKSDSELKTKQSGLSETQFRNLIEYRNILYKELSSLITTLYTLKSPPSPLLFRKFAKDVLLLVWGKFSIVSKTVTSVKKRNLDNLGKVMIRYVYTPPGMHGFHWYIQSIKSIIRHIYDINPEEDIDCEFGNKKCTRGCFNHNVMDTMHDIINYEGNFYKFICSNCRPNLTKKISQIRSNLDKKIKKLGIQLPEVEFLKSISMQKVIICGQPSIPMLLDGTSQITEFPVFQSKHSPSKLLSFGTSILAITTPLCIDNSSSEEIKLLEYPNYANIIVVIPETKAQPSVRCETKAQPLVRWTDPEFEDDDVDINTLKFKIIQKADNLIKVQEELERLERLKELEELQRLEELETSS